MKTNTMRSLLALLLAVSFLLTACGSKPEPIPEPDPVEDLITELVFLNPLTPPEDGLLTSNIPNLLPIIKEYNEKNPHTIGWLQVANTTIDDVVVKHPDDTSNSKAFYLRNDFYGNYLFDGTYFIDYRALMGTTRADLSPNTVLYGHSYTDNTEGVLLDQLKKLREDEEFVEQNPYIYFSLEEENLVWEIFAAFDTKIDFNYNFPNPTTEQFEEILSEAKKRSYFTYDVDVTPEDKIFTISTCTYNYTRKYPNDYRYVVMARLVGEDEKLVQTAKAVKNTDRKIP